MAIEFELDDGSIIEYSEIIPDNEKKIYNEDPLVYTIDNFITPEECNHIINVSKNNLTRAMVGAGIDKDNMNGTYSKNRTGTNCWFKHDYDDVFFRVGQKIANMVGHPLENAEEFQIVHYNVGEEFMSHMDGWQQDGSEEHFFNFERGGNRLLTALVYLNTVEEGGGTQMTKLNKIIKSEQGKMLVFEDCYKGTNERHPMSEHAGMPVIRGEKYAFNLWFKECPQNILYKDFKPGYFERFKNGNHTEYNSDEDIPPLEEDFGLVSLHDSKTIYIKKDLCIDLSTFNQNTFKSYKDRSIKWINKADMVDYIQSIENYLQIDKSYLENIYVVKYNIP